MRQVLAAIFLAAFVAACAPIDKPTPVTPRLMSENCKAWIAHIVDGNAGMWGIVVEMWALEEIAITCLGRETQPHFQPPQPARMTAV